MRLFLFVVLGAWCVGTIRAQNARIEIAPRPFGVRIWQRVSNFLAYRFPADADGLPASVYKRDISRYPSQALEHDPPYGETFDTESLDEDVVEPYSHEYNTYQWSLYQLAGDEHFAADPNPDCGLPMIRYRKIFRFQQVYSSRGIGELIRPKRCEDERFKQVFRVDALKFVGTFIDGLNKIGDELDTKVVDPLANFRKSHLMGYIHPLPAFIAFDLYEKVVTMPTESLTSYVTTHDGDTLFTYRASRSKDLYAYSHGTFVWMAQNFSSTKVTKSRLIDSVQSQDFLLGFPNKKVDIDGQQVDINDLPLLIEELVDFQDHQPIEQTQGQFRLTLVWDDWSCCSACCCEEEECGNLYASNCHEVESYRRRRSLYHIQKIKPDTNLTGGFQGINALFGVEPYRTVGIPVASTIWRALPKIWSKLAKLFSLEDTTMESVWKQYFELADCNKHPQKLNCTAWDLCYGVEREYIPRDKNETMDPCIGLDFLIIKVSREKREVEIEEEKIYRILIDFDAFQQEPQEVVWTTSAQRVPDLPVDGQCDGLQALYRHPNHGDLLIPSIGNTRNTLYVDARWNGGRNHLQVVIRLKKEKTEDQGSMLSIMWIVVLIMAYFVLMGCLCAVSWLGNRHYAKGHLDG